MTEQKITVYLWFDGNAEEAVTFYTSMFPGSRIVEAIRYGDAGPGPKGSVMSVVFEMDGRRYMALNGGPRYKFTPAISLFVSCEDQAEVDRLWNRILETGGKPTACGWIDDRFGLSWQIIPKRLMELLREPDQAKSARVMKAMLAMVKIDVAALEAAYAG